MSNGAIKVAQDVILGGAIKFLGSSCLRSKVGELSTTKNPTLASLGLGGATRGLVGGSYSGIQVRAGGGGNQEDSAAREKWRSRFGEGKEGGEDVESHVACHTLIEY